jgi:7,8-dihydro-6-hydroxymethylpterin dimethyltransferase
MQPTDVIPTTAQEERIEKNVLSVCPICLKVIPAHIFQEGKEVFIEKKCQIHGEFKDIYWSDAAMYRKFYRYSCQGSGIESPLPEQRGCPMDCGLCENHLTGTLLANIDLTTRCNMSCPICFADSGTQSFEPTIDQIKAMMKNLRSQRPVPCSAIQLSGGEPTLRNDLPEIVKLAKLMGFSQVQIATNGLILSANLELCRKLERAGLSTIYLQFDGISEKSFKEMRGRNFLPIKLQAIENFRKAALTSIVLVPTLARGINDDQMGPIIRFASNNLDVIKGINVQPVSFAGRIDQEERLEKRITIPDFLSLVEEQTDNQITREDFYPVPFVAPISRLIALETKQPQPVFTVHPCCGAATYVYCIDGKLIPINRFLDVEGLLERIGEEAEKFDNSGLGKLKMKGNILRDISKFADNAKAPRDLNVAKMLLSVFWNGTKQSLREFHSRSLFLGVMHFQDQYNMDLERLQSCGVHYATPDGRIIPFCSYNTIHRKALEYRLLSKTNM